MDVGEIMGGRAGPTARRVFPCRFSSYSSCSSETGEIRRRSRKKSTSRRRKAQVGVAGTKAQLVRSFPRWNPRGIGGRHRPLSRAVAVRQSSPVPAPRLVTGRPLAGACERTADDQPAGFQPHGAWPGARIQSCLRAPRRVFLAAVNDVESRITRLEERYTHLQKHVAEQDRVILDLSERLDRLRKDFARMRTESSGTPAAGNEMPADERPPHY